jgi:phage/plasmid-associated DNA primase
VEAGIALKMKLSNDVLNEYLKMNQLFLSRAYEMDGNKNQKHPYIDNAKKLLEVTLKLQDITFKDKLMKECSALFYDSKFVEKLDVKSNLICFENGVYDLDTREFRDGRPEDFCNLSTMTDYQEFDMENSPEIDEIKNFMSQVFPISRVRDYVYLLLSSFLLGKNPNEKFHVWTGTGG